MAGKPSKRPTTPSIFGGEFIPQWAYSTSIIPATTVIGALFWFRPPACTWNSKSSQIKAVLSAGVLLHPSRKLPQFGGVEVRDHPVGHSGLSPMQHIESLTRESLERD